MRNLALITMTAGFLAAGSLAQAAPPMAAAPAPMAKKSMAPHAAATPRTAISLNCSQQADTKSLHGKDREKFRKACMKSGK